MNDDTLRWLAYADENFAAAQLALDSSLYNPCLQSCQQAIEKWLKALLLFMGKPVRKTHQIVDIISEIKTIRDDIYVEENDIAFIDSIYLPSKYPFDSVFALFEPTLSMCEKSITIASDVHRQVMEIMGL